jgi:hypothetical protein
MDYREARLLDLIAGNAALFTEDARRAMRRYVDLVSRFETLDLAKILEVTKDLRAGREVEFVGR